MAKRLDAARTLAEAQQVAGLARDSKALREVWDAPSIPAEQKRAVLDSIVQKVGLSRPVRNFVAVLIDKRRTRFLSDIVTQFAQELNQRLGFAEAAITTARELNADERVELEGDLARVTGKNIRAKYAQDRTILGGAIAGLVYPLIAGSPPSPAKR